MTHSTLLFVEYVDTIKPSVSVSDFETETLYFFRFFKDQYSLLVKKTRTKHQMLSSEFLLTPSRRQDHAYGVTHLVEVNGIEPMTSCLQSRRSPN